MVAAAAQGSGMGLTRGGARLHLLLLLPAAALVAALVLSTLSGIFQTALYRYAAGKPSQGAFASTDLQAAFCAK